MRLHARYISSGIEKGISSGTRVCAPPSRQPLCEGLSSTQTTGYRMAAKSEEEACRQIQVLQEFASDGAPKEMYLEEW